MSNPLTTHSYANCMVGVSCDACHQGIGLGIPLTCVHWNDRRLADLCPACQDRVAEVLEAEAQRLLEQTAQMRAAAREVGTQGGEARHADLQSR